METATSGTGDRSDAYSRPAARFDADGDIEIRASAALGCRRGLWYTATGQEPTDPPSDSSLTVMDAGNALEPVVIRAIRRAGWRIDAPDPHNPLYVAVPIGPGLVATGHPDATGLMPVGAAGAAPAAGDMLFGDAPGAEMVIEVKTRAPEAFRRWQKLGAERSHPGTVVQAAIYTLGVYGEMRDAVIATLDTGSRTWDYEVIPAVRLRRALERASGRLNLLVAHHAAVGPDPDALPDRDFPASSWQCRSCPFLSACLPGDAERDAETPAEDEAAAVSDGEALEAVAAYAKAHEAAREPEKAKRAALGTLKAWMRRRNEAQATLAGRRISLVSSTRYSVNHKRLNSVLEPEVRAEIVTESESEYVRVA